MSRKLNHPKISELKKREAPISYSSLSVNELGQLAERKSLLSDRVVEGYGVIWGVENSHSEVFVKGCFAKSISELGPGSNSNYSLKFRDEHGRSCSLFEELKEDDIGLYFRTKPLDNVQWCNDLLVQLESGTINNFSIGFKHCWDKIEWDDDNDTMINLEARLFEISAVSIPSDMETFAIRSDDNEEFLLEEIEDFIETLQKSNRLKARKIFTKCLSLSKQEPEKRNTNPLEDNKPKESCGLNYDYLLKNF